MMKLKNMGISDFQSVATPANATTEHRMTASYFKVKAGSNTAPRLNTRIIEMPKEYYEFIH